MGQVTVPPLDNSMVAGVYSLGIWLLKLWLASWFWLADVMVSFAHNGLGTYLLVDSYCVSWAG